MSNEEILEGNKLIMQFLEIPQLITGEYHAVFGNIRQYYTGENYLKFHSSWDWLMPVIDSIKCYTVDEYTLIDNIDDALICIDIEETYQSCVEFIKWYNKQKQND